MPVVFLVSLCGLAVDYEILSVILV